MNTRQYILGLALIATAVASLNSMNEPSSEIVEAVTPKTKRSVSPQHKESDILHSAPRKWILSEKTIDLFYVPPKVAPAVTIEKKPKLTTPAPPPQPVAPPLPFTYLGKIIEENQVIVFVTKAGRNLIIKGGETIDGTYNVKSIDSQKVVFVYLPLKTEQTLIIRGAN